MLRSVTLEADRILSDICDENCITLDELKGPSRTADMAATRDQAYEALRALDLSWSEVGRILNRTHSSALRGAQRRAQKPPQLPPFMPEAERRRARIEAGQSVLIVKGGEQ